MRRDEAEAAGLVALEVDPDDALLLRRQPRLLAAVVGHQLAGDLLAHGGDDRQPAAAALVARSAAWRAAGSGRDRSPTRPGSDPRPGRRRRPRAAGKPARCAPPGLSACSRRADGARVGKHAGRRAGQGVDPHRDAQRLRRGVDRDDHLRGGVVGEQLGRIGRLVRHRRGRSPPARRHRRAAGAAVAGSAGSNARGGAHDGGGDLHRHLGAAQGGDARQGACEAARVAGHARRAASSPPARLTRARPRPARRQRSARRSSTRVALVSSVTSSPSRRASAMIAARSRRSDGSPPVRTISFAPAARRAGDPRPQRLGARQLRIIDRPPARAVGAVLVARQVGRDGLGAHQTSG